MAEYSTASVYRNLDAKMKVMGLEAFDLLIALIIAGVMNLLLGQTPLALPFGVGLPLGVLIVLHLSKRNKPDRYLEHWVRYNWDPGFLSAGEGDDLSGAPSQNKSFKIM